MMIHCLYISFQVKLFLPSLSRLTFMFMFQIYCLKSCTQTPTLSLYANRRLQQTHILRAIFYCAYQNMRKVTRIILKKALRGRYICNSKSAYTEQSFYVNYDIALLQVSSPICAHSAMFGSGNSQHSTFPCHA